MVVIRIIPCPQDLIDEAEALVRSVFAYSLPFVWASFLILKQPDSWPARLFKRVSGIKDILAFDVAVDDGVLGTTGLYRTRKDADEAVWVFWFCVAPEARGQGMGQALLDHTFARAREFGYDTVRLYTSTDPNEAIAQHLYEKNGLRETGRRFALFTTIIYREKALE